MTLGNLLAELPHAIAETPPEQLVVVIAQLAACQNTAAARLLNSHQCDDAERKMPPTEQASLLTIAQVAERLSVPRSYAYDLVRQQKLPAVRLGKYVRVTQEALAKFIATASSCA